jgi:uncharacterized protein
MKTDYYLDRPEGHHHHPDPKLKDLKLTLWNLPRIPFLVLILGYQNTISKALPKNTCRFYPSCSHYAFQSIYKYGLIRGGFMSAWRVLRCNPFSRGGFDPVP